MTCQARLGPWWQMQPNVQLGVRTNLTFRTVLDASMARWAETGPDRVGVLSVAVARGSACGLRRNGFRSWEDTIGVPAAARGGWLLVEAAGLWCRGRIVAAIDQIDEAGEPAAAPVLLYPAGAGRQRAVLFAGDRLDSLRLRVYGRLTAGQSAGLRHLHPIGAVAAAVLLFGRDPGALRRLWRGGLPIGRARLASRIRAAEAEIIGRRAGLQTYADWRALFDSWDPEDLPPSSPELAIGYLVFSQGAEAPLAATLSSLRAQGGSVAITVVRPGADWLKALDALPVGADFYVGLLQAGEILAPHATALAAAGLAELGRPALALADGDRVGDGGERMHPLFGPEPNHTLMLSGTLARGLWLVRRDVLETHAASRTTDWAGDKAWAEVARLSLWLRRRETGGDGGRRLPRLLSSRRADTETAPPALLAAEIDRHLERTSLPFRATPSWPVRLRLLPTASPDSVTALVPSSLTAPHAEACLDAILSGTDHPRFDVIVGVSQPYPLDAAQQAIATRLAARHARLRVLHLPAPGFNFASTINRMAAVAGGAQLLLLNDDVSPIAPDWLTRMAAYLADPRVGAVGARLLYSDGTVQHAGVIMGLAGLCEHAFRHQAGGAPGHGYRAMLPQQVSAVTGACLLMPSQALRAVGGMDEGYPSAFNDVDLCLRIGQAGLDVVLSDTTLTHHELQTYGAHHAGDRAPFLAVEVARMHASWSQQIAADPFYNPNLSLDPLLAWTPCFPPRLPLLGAPERPMIAARHAAAVADIA